MQRMCLTSSRLAVGVMRDSAAHPSTGLLVLEEVASVRHGWQSISTEIPIFSN